MFEKLSRESIKAVLLKFGIAILFHGTILTQNLVGQADGTWQGPYYMATTWELSLGRWAILFWDKLHFGMSVQPFILLLMLFLFVVGTEVAASVMDQAGMKASNLLMSLLFLSNVVIDASMSFSFTAVIYGFAFLFATLCALAVKKASGVRGFKCVAIIVLGAGSLALLMGFYQGYLGCALLLILGYMIKQLYDAVSLREFGRFVITGLAVGGLGLAVYEAILNLNLRISETTLADYGGNSSISLGKILSSLPQTGKDALKNFYYYYTSASLGQHNLYSGTYVIWIFIGIGGMILVLQWLRQKDLIRVLLTALCYALFPLAATVTMLLAPGSGILVQSSGALAFSLVLLGMVAMATLGKELPGVKYAKALQGILGIACVIYLWGSIHASLIDQEAMREGKLATSTLAQTMLHTLVEEGYYPNEDVTYAFVGSAPGNSLFSVTGLYYSANGYARCGAAGIHTVMDSYTWNGIYKYFIGANLMMCLNEKYEELLQDERVTEMPVYPADGSIMAIDDVVVIKVSN